MAAVKGQLMQVTAVYPKKVQLLNPCHAAMTAVILKPHHIWISSAKMRIMVH
jgi:hypothetical protein